MKSIVNYWYCIENNNNKLFIPKELLALIHEYLKLVMNLPDYVTIIGENRARSRIICAFQSKQHWIITGAKLLTPTQSKITAKKTTSTKNSVSKPMINQASDGFESAIDAMETVYEHIWQHVHKRDRCKKDSSKVANQYPRKTKR